MLTAYFDDSGTSPNESIAVVAGYIATTDMWEVFDRRWSSLLSKYEVTQLHRADVESFQGEFGTWNPARRTEFVKKAHAIIRRCTYAGVGLALVKKDFEEVVPQSDPLQRYGIFGWCAHGCLAGVYTWCKKYNWNEPIHYVFEAGTKGQEQFNRTLSTLYKNDKSREQNRIGGWSFQTKATMPLQAADVLAYEYYKFIHNEIVDGRKRPIRLSARDLFRQHELDFFTHFDKNGFEIFLEHWRLAGIADSES
jgi:hypothetical protein